MPGPGARFTRPGTPGDENRRAGVGSALLDLPGRGGGGRRTDPYGEAGPAIRGAHPDATLGAVLPALRHGLARLPVLGQVGAVPTCPGPPLAGSGSPDPRAVRILEEIA